MVSEQHSGEVALASRIAANMAGQDVAVDLLQLETFDQQRQRLLHWLQQREQIDDDLARMQNILQEAGIDMNTPLVDRHGFPRNDLNILDIPAIRSIRHRINCLQNDRRQLTDQLEQLLVVIHERARDRRQRHAAQVLPGRNNQASTGTQTSLSGNEVGDDAVGTDGNAGLGDEALAATLLSSTDQAGQSAEPFLLVNKVTPGSPAEASGLRVGDLITRFGLVDRTNFTSLNDIAATVARNVGNILHVHIIRSEQAQIIKLQPHAWSGRGYLGCNVVPQR